MIKPWSSRPAVIDVVLGLFDATTKSIDFPTPGSENGGGNTEPNIQLPDLAATLFACIQERLDWLGRYDIDIFFLMKVNSVPALWLQMNQVLIAIAMNYKRSLPSFDQRYWKRYVGDF